MHSLVVWRICAFNCFLFQVSQGKDYSRGFCNRATLQVHIYFKLSKLGLPGSINPASFPSGQWIYRGSNNCQAKCLVKWRAAASGGSIYHAIDFVTAVS